MIKRVLILFLLFFIVSCNFRIEKRRYFKGYHVEFQQTNHAIPVKISNTSLVSDDDNRHQNNEFDQTLISLKNLNPNKNKQSKSLELINSARNFKAPSDHKKTEYSKLNKVQTGFIKKKETETTIQIKKLKNKHDGYLYGLTALIGLSMFGFFQKFKTTSAKISIWAARNKSKTKLIIGVIQTMYGILGVAIGKGLHDFGFEFSSTSTYIFGGIFILGIITLLIQKIASKIDLFKSFFRIRMSHFAIALSSIMMMIVVGNKVGQGNPTHSPAGYIIEQIHNKSFAKQTAEVLTINTADKEKDPSIDKGALIALYVFLAILLGIGLVVLCCAVWCWALLTSPADPLLYVLAIAVTVLSIFLFIVVIRAMTRSVKELTPEEPTF